MTSLVVNELVVEVGGNEILHGVSLSVSPGEVVAIMGPNGSGKSTLSHAIMGRDGYRIVSGSISVDGEAVTEIPTYRRAQLGLALVSQYPGEVPGVDAFDLVDAARTARGPLGSSEVRAAVHAAAGRVGLAPELLDRWVNVDLSGGEKKRFETTMLSALPSRYAILDELDSGLDVDAMRAVAREVRRLVTEEHLGVLAITHYARLLDELPPSRILVLVKGEIVAEGGPELARELEETGYADYGDHSTPEASPSFEDIFGLP
ncbi:MAG: Fe-S cluster assembly ATPase SufC [Acidimicrobiales bacterium]